LQWETVRYLYAFASKHNVQLYADANSNELQAATDISLI